MSFFPSNISTSPLGLCGVATGRGETSGIRYRGVVWTEELAVFAVESWKSRQVIAVLQGKSQFGFPRNVGSRTPKQYLHEISLQALLWCFGGKWSIFTATSWPDTFLLHLTHIFGCGHVSKLGTPNKGVACNQFLQNEFETQPNDNFKIITFHMSSCAFLVLFHALSGCLFSLVDHLVLCQDTQWTLTLMLKVWQVHAGTGRTSCKLVQLNHPKKSPNGTNFNETDLGTWSIADHGKHCWHFFPKACRKNIIALRLEPTILTRQMGALGAIALEILANGTTKKVACGLVTLEWWPLECKLMYEHLMIMFVPINLHEFSWVQ